MKICRYAHLQMLKEGADEGADVLARAEEGRRCKKPLVSLCRSPPVIHPLLVTMAGVLAAVNSSNLRDLSDKGGPACELHGGPIPSLSFLRISSNVLLPQTAQTIPAAHGAALDAGGPVARIARGQPHQRLVVAALAQQRLAAVAQHAD